MQVQLEYYQPVFNLLHERLTDRIRIALLKEPADFRAQYLLQHLPIERELPPETAWPVARKLLDALEARIKPVLSLHSIFFWLHIYRRVDVALNPEHEDRTDQRTLWLVRQIVELAITKYGRATDANEFVLSSRVKPDLILGGFMRAGIKTAAPSRPNKTYRNFANLLRSHPQWVIKDFSEDDFVNIYSVEGLAYQYWRVTALLRSLGKGARLIIGNDGDWYYAQDDELMWLMQSIDERTSRGGLDRSLLGVWIDEDSTQDESGKKPVFDLLICPVYNVDRVPLGGGISAAWITWSGRLHQQLSTHIS